MKHPAAQYEIIEGVPGEYFRCDRLRGILSIDACVKRWTAAKDSKNEACGICRGCPIGAAHAGQAHQPLSNKVCVRCNRPSVRMIRGLLCVSCANREYEIRRGKNRKGRPPEPQSAFFDGEWKRGTIMQLHEITVRCAECGTVKLRAATLSEAYRHVSRKRPGTRFAWTAPACRKP